MLDDDDLRQLDNSLSLSLSLSSAHSQSAQNSASPIPLFEQIQGAEIDNDQYQNQNRLVDNSYSFNSNDFAELNNTKNSLTAAFNNTIHDNDNNITNNSDKNNNIGFKNDVEGNSQGQTEFDNYRADQLQFQPQSLGNNNFHSPIVNPLLPSPKTLYSHQQPLPRTSNFQADMLLEARTELNNLRSLNQRILAMNEENRTKIDKLMYDKERAITDAKTDYEAVLQSMVGAHNAEKSEWMGKLEHLRKEFQLVKTDAAQIKDIKASLIKEKEMDILGVKKMIMEEKEKHLLFFQGEMERDRKIWDKEKVKLENEVAGLTGNIEKIHQHSSNLQLRLGEETTHVCALEQGNEDMAVRIAILEDQAASFDAKKVVCSLLIDLLMDFGIQMDSNCDVPALVNVLRDVYRGQEEEIRTLRSVPNSDGIRVEEVRRNFAKQMEEFQRIHDSQIKTLKSQLDQERRRVEEYAKNFASSPSSSPNRLEGSVEKRLQTLIESHPLAFAHFKSRLETQHQTHMSSLITDNNIATQDLISRLESEKQSLASRRHTESTALKSETTRLREELRLLKNNFDNKIHDATRKLKEQCGNAYAGAVKKLKDEYVRQEGILRDRFEGEVDRVQGQRMAMSLGAGKLGELGDTKVCCLSFFVIRNSSFLMGLFAASGRNPQDQIEQPRKAPSVRS